ncbi:hypothetical protein [Clostridium intestinale]|uniref:Glycine zipper family protein n=1 Tax=Clostridium intestinale DSM 6191 TaxID=1121320 RepID=A0A1M5ZDB6_9CLOT|nr:hypothetical protein [Clostridium intestinale]SHI22151.1 hypothetical protein SAMN02745941_02814 [Clostridium intestinale DSM 6191]
MERDKLNSTDDDITRISYGIAFGSGIGVVLGAVISNVPLGFSLGGVSGILISIVYNFVVRSKKGKK